MANGIADNMLITTYLSMKAPVFIAPAMDLDMYKHPSTQENMERLKGYGNTIIEPASGFLASGLEGKGRMEEPEIIIEKLNEFFMGERLKVRGERIDLKGKKVLITAGPTYEKIDPVRFIGNYSSGKMGFALAEECAQRGAEVTLVAGPVSLKCSEAIHRIDVESCEEMYQATTEAFKSSDAAILCAAVADFRPETQAKEKIKRESQGEAPSKKRGSSGDPEDKGMTLRLVPNPDIAAALGKMKTEKQVMVGFALETNDEEVNAKKKLEKKNLDFIVLNSLQNKGTCFQSDENQISIISKEGQRDYEKKTKLEVARDIVEELGRRMKEEGRGKKEEGRGKKEEGRGKM
jgi:phosphopantothenoylcysteine decarboxylase/phosphopantothenate--cysteine ligase